MALLHVPGELALHFVKFQAVFDWSSQLCSLIRLFGCFISIILSDGKISSTTVVFLHFNAASPYPFLQIMSSPPLEGNLIGVVKFIPEMPNFVLSSRFRGQFRPIRPVNNGYSSFYLETPLLFRSLGSLPTFCAHSIRKLPPNWRASRSSGSHSTSVWFFPLLQLRRLTFNFWLAFR